MRPATTITGPRADLMSVRGAADVRRLAVRGPGVGSLAGIERFTALVALTLERLEAPDLGRLRALGSLQELALDDVSGPVEAAAVGELRALRRLQVLVGDRGVAAAFGDLDLGGLPDLDYVLLHYSGPAPFVPVRLAWVERAPALQVVRLGRFVFDDEDTDRVCALRKRLSQLAFTPRSEQQRERVMRAFPSGRAVPEDADDAAVLGVRQLARDEWELGLLIADEWRMETTADAVDLLESELLRRDAELARRVRVDEDGDLVRVLADRPEDAHAVERIVRQITPTTPA